MSITSPALLGYRAGPMRPLGFLCGLALVRRGCVHKNAAVQCSSAVPGYPPRLSVAYSPNVGVNEFCEFRLYGVLGSSALKSARAMSPSPLLASAM